MPSNSNFKSLFSLSMWRIHDAVENSQNDDYEPYEAYEMEFIHDESKEEIRTEWTVSVFKNNLREQLLWPIQYFRRINPQAMKIDVEDSHNFRNIKPKDANYVFLWAAFRGQLTLMQFCVKRGADVSFINGNNNFNALHLSAMAGSVECCQWLLEKGCPIVETTDNMTPIHYATLGNSKHVVEYLINYGCPIPSTAINTAVFANAVECVRFLLSYEVDVNAYREGMTPLHVATDLRNIECMEELLNDPRINADSKTEIKGYTALHIAAEDGYVDCIELLLKKNATIGEVNTKLQTPLHVACKMEYLESIEILLNNYAPVNEKDSDNKTPLHAAIGKSPNSLAKVQLLVRRKANVNVSDRYGYTPLHLAALNESEECATFLILNGANVAAETKNGVTALNMINRKTPKSALAVWKRLTKSLAYNTEQSLKFSFRELITNSNVGETGFLYALQKEDHKDILKHPLCRAFLYLKWQKIRLIYFIRVFSVVLTACILSYLVLYDIIKKVDNNLYVNCKNENYTKEALSTLNFSLSHNGNHSVGCVLKICFQNTTSDEPPTYKVIDYSASCNLINSEGENFTITNSSVFCKSTEISIDGSKEKNISVICNLTVTLLAKNFNISNVTLTCNSTNSFDKNFKNVPTNSSTSCNSSYGEIQMREQNSKTDFLSSLLEKICPAPENCTNSKPSNERNNSSQSELKIYFETLWYVAIMLVISNVIRNLSCKNAYPSFKKYILNNMNFFEAVIMISVLVLFLTKDHSYCICTLTSTRKLIGTLLILFTWTYLTFVIGQLPFFGTYISMFSKVFKELLKLLTVYFCLLIGFTSTFRAIHSDEEKKFDDLFTGFAETLAMMAGELNANQFMGKEGTTSRTSVHVFVSTMILICFIVVVNMALMNLLIGIAVSDVDGLQKTADLSKLVHQTKLIYYLEFAFFRGYIPRKFTKLFKKFLFVSPNFYRVVMYVRPLNPLEKRLPQDIMIEALQLALDKNKPDRVDTPENMVIRKLEKLENEILNLRNLLSNLSNIGNSTTE